jgi:hypothetical protein
MRETNDVQIPLWNSALAKSPVSEYPPHWPLEWLQQAQADGLTSPQIPIPPAMPVARGTSS